VCIYIKKNYKKKKKKEERKKSRLFLHLKGILLTKRKCMQAILTSKSLIPCSFIKLSGFPAFPS
jgi:hypothetical protein